MTGRPADLHAGEDPRSHDRGGQPLAAPATPFREPEEPTESRRPRSNSGPCIPCVANLLGQQFIHLDHGQCLEPKISFLDLCEEPMKSPDWNTRQFGRQSSFPQRVSELGDMIGVRLMDCGRWLATAPGMSATERHGP